jgi:small conductance mechanosensitive channel
MQEITTLIKNLLNTNNNSSGNFIFDMTFFYLFIKKSIIIVLIWVGGNKLINISKKIIQDSLKIDKPKFVTFLVLLIENIFKIFLFLIILSQFGVPQSTIITIVTAITLTIAYSLKESLNNFAACLLLYTVYHDTIFKDEIIEIDGLLGVIQDIDLFSTKLKTFDNKLIVIPNNDLITNRIINYNHYGIRRVDTRIQLEYSVTFERIYEIINDNFLKEKKEENTLESNKLIIRENDKKPIFYLESLEDNGVYYNLRCYVKKEDYYKFITNIYKDIKAILDKKVIAFPFPQLDIHLDDNTMKKIKENKKKK